MEPVAGRKSAYDKCCRLEPAVGEASVHKIAAIARRRHPSKMNGAFQICNSFMTTIVTRPRATETTGPRALTFVALLPDAPCMDSIEPFVRHFHDGRLGSILRVRYGRRNPLGRHWAAALGGNGSPLRASKASHAAATPCRGSGLRPVLEQESTLRRGISCRINRPAW